MSETLSAEEVRYVREWAANGNEPRRTGVIPDRVAYECCHGHKISGKAVMSSAGLTIAAQAEQIAKLHCEIELVDGEWKLCLERTNRELREELSKRDEQIDKLKTAVATQVWQSIETAPKEGRFLVLLSAPLLNNRIHTANWHPNCRTIGSFFDYDCPPVTHWMPLPAFPEAI